MAALKVKELHSLSGEIIRLEEQLALARAKLNALMGLSEPERKARTHNVDSVRGKAIAWLESHQGSIYSISQVAEAVGEDELQVGKSLYNAARANKIENPSRGHYRATEKEVASEEGTS